MNNVFPDSVFHKLEQALREAKKMKFNSYCCENSNHNSGYCDSFKDCLNAIFSRISIGKFIVSAIGRQIIFPVLSLCSENNDVTKIFMKKLWKKTVRFSNHDVLKIAVV